MPIRLMLDSMLGTLATRLRMLGIDAAYIHHADDIELKYRCRAEGRLLLSKDTQLVAGMGEGAILVTGDGADEEFASIVPFLRVKLGTVGPVLPLSRCLECNQALEALTPDQARGRVPDHVLRTTSDFLRCPGCGRVFWPGTHSAAMAARVQHMLAVLGYETK